MSTTYDNGNRKNISLIDNLHDLFEFAHEK